MGAKHRRYHRQDRRIARVKLSRSGTLVELEPLPSKTPRRDKDACAKPLGHGLLARDFDRHVAEVRVRIATLNGCPAPGPRPASSGMNPSWVRREPSVS